MKKRIAVFFAAAFLLAALGGCGKEPAGSSSGELSQAESLPESSEPESSAPSLPPEEPSEESGETALEGNLPLRELTDITDGFLGGGEVPYALRFTDSQTLAVEFSKGEETGTGFFSLETWEALPDETGTAGISLPNSYDRLVPLDDGRIAYITEDLTKAGVRNSDGSGDRVLLNAAEMEGVDSFWVILAKNGIAGISGNTHKYLPSSYCVDLDNGEVVNTGISGTVIPQCIEGDRILFLRDYVFSEPENDCLYVYDNGEKALAEIPTGSTLGCTWAVLSTGGDYVLALTEENQEENIRSFAVFDAATGEKVNSALIRDLPAPMERSLSFALNGDGTILAVTYYRYPGDYTHCGVALYRLD